MSYEVNVRIQFSIWSVETSLGIAQKCLTELIVGNQTSNEWSGVIHVGADDEPLPNLLCAAISKAFMACYWLPVLQRSPICTNIDTSEAGTHSTGRTSSNKPLRHFQSETIRLTQAHICNSTEQKTTYRYVRGKACNWEEHCKVRHHFPSMWLPTAPFNHSESNLLLLTTNHVWVLIIVHHISVNYRCKHCVYCKHDQYQ
jgi:hypothetical protein